jgi:hypothetical protein
MLFEPWLAAANSPMFRHVFFIVLAVFVCAWVYSMVSDS